MVVIYSESRSNCERALIGQNPTDPLPTQGSRHRLTDLMFAPVSHQFCLRLSVLPIRLYRLLLGNVSRRSIPGVTNTYSRNHTCLAGLTACTLVLRTSTAWILRRRALILKPFPIFVKPKAQLHFGQNQSSTRLPHDVPANNALLYVASEVYKAADLDQFTHDAVNLTDSFLHRLLKNTTAVAYGNFLRHNNSSSSSHQSPRIESSKAKCRGHHRI
jgi:hypothetical protein